MLVGEPGGLEPALELSFENLLDQILEAPVVDLENRVFRRQVHGIVATQSVIEAGMGKTADGAIQVEHSHDDAGTVGLDDFALDRGAAAGRREHELERAGGWEREIGGPILIAESMA